MDTFSYVVFEVCLELKVPPVHLLDVQLFDVSVAVSYVKPM